MIESSIKKHLHDEFLSMCLVMWGKYRTYSLLFLKTSGGVFLELLESSTPCCLQLDKRNSVCPICSAVCKVDSRCNVNL